jgi:hypothetical protein
LSKPGAHDAPLALGGNATLSTTEMLMDPQESTSD